MTRRILSFAIVITLSALSVMAQAVESDLAGDLAKLQSAAVETGISDDAQAAWKRIAASEPSQLPALLAGMNGASGQSENWIRMAIDTVAERALQQGGSLPSDQLLAFLNDRTQSSRARTTAYEWITKADPDAAEQLLPKMLDDPSPELRYKAVNRLLEAAKVEGVSPEKQLELETAALDASLDVEQTKDIAERLKEREQEINLTNYLGFCTAWQAVWPFDNKDQKGFDVVYSPEKMYADSGSIAATEPEQKSKVVEATGELGELDLATEIDKLKGTIAYTYSKFKLDGIGGPATLRYSSRNATKVWLNGKLVASNEVYHSGNSVDQYQAPVTLESGENTLLVKVCQNEQTQGWAQNWELQLRFTDPIGTPLRPQWYVEPKVQTTE